MIDVMNWYVDLLGLVWMGIGYDDDKCMLCLLYCLIVRDSFKIVDCVDMWVKDSLIILILISDFVGFLWIISGYEGFDVFYELDVVRLVIGKCVFGVDGYDVDGVVCSFDGKLIIGIYYISDYVYVNWFDLVLVIIQVDFDKVVVLCIVCIVLMSFN